MHNVFAGMMGVWMGLSSMFHGGHGLTNNPSHMQQMRQAVLSGTPVPTGTWHKGMGRGMKLPAGEKPFFGTVTAVNGNTLTVQMTFPGRGFKMHPSVTPTVTPPAPQTLTITLDASTQYKNGAASDITVNTKIAGIGKTNSDGSMTAVMVTINPSMSGPGSFRGQRKDNDNDKY